MAKAKAKERGFMYQNPECPSPPFPGSSGKDTGEWHGQDRPGSIPASACLPCCCGQVSLGLGFLTQKMKLVAHQLVG